LNRAHSAHEAGKKWKNRMRKSTASLLIVCPAISTFKERKMKDLYLVLLAMVAGVGAHTMLRGVMAGIRSHQATLQTVVWLVLALACWRYGWPMK
jgi:hypothetical protein